MTITTKMTMSSNPARGFFQATRAPARRRLTTSLLALASVLATSAAALAQEAPLDPDLQFALDNGFTSFFFAQTCVSVGPGGDVIGGDSLPVGDGRQLECETAPVSHLQAIDLQASTGEPFCVLGQLASVSGENVDRRLSVDVASTPDGGPWLLIGTSAEAITIGRVAGPLGATAFPLAAEANFDVIDLQPNPTGGFCADLFGL